MKKRSFIYSALLSLTLLSGCSLSPGVPGLSIDSSRYAKKQVEGRDYKLVVINANTIQKQKPFNYANYIAERKKRYQALSNPSHATYRSHILQKGKKQGGWQKQTSNSRILINKRKKYFSGVSTNDNKANYQYRIGKKDILSITVWDHPELTVPSEDPASAGHVVDNNGRFYFPYAGKIHALGKTPADVRDVLEKKLSSFITNPQVSVRVALFRSQKAYVSGAVPKPSTLNINDVPTTVRDAISKSGGVIPNQYTGYASLARGNKKILIDLNRMLKHNDNRQNFLLKNGDRLHIIEKDQLAEEIQKQNVLNPIKLQFELQKEREIARLKKQLERELKSEQAKVFVMGEVHKPGSVRYQIEDGMTLAEAVNDAGSFREETVNPKGIFVVRQDMLNDKIPTVYQLPIVSVHSMLLAEQFKIRPRDIIYVTATPSIRWNRVLAQLIPSLTLVNTVSNLSR